MGGKKPVFLTPGVLSDVLAFEVFWLVFPRRRAKLKRTASLFFLRKLKDEGCVGMLGRLGPPVKSSGETRFGF